MLNENWKHICKLDQAEATGIYIYIYTNINGTGVIQVGRVLESFVQQT